MSIFEYNEEEEMRKLREGEREIWEKRGKIKGQVEGLARSCLFALESHGTVSEWLKKRIMEEPEGSGKRITSSRKKPTNQKQWYLSRYAEKRNCSPSPFVIQ